MGLSEEQVPVKGYMDQPIDPGIRLADEINRMRREKNAVILSHYYVDPELQEIADYVGDSLGLSQEAAATQADIIVFIGVNFMAETAKILSPSKKVLLPDLKAGCSLADSAPAGEFAAFKSQYPDHKVISYINCTAELKTMTDVICTSANAVKIVDLMNLYPGAELIAHPECVKPVLLLARYIGSTTALLKYVQQSSAGEFIVATESGILHQMRKSCPDKTFIPAPPLDSTCGCNDCSYMKLNTLQKVYLCMKYEKPEIILSQEILDKARQPIIRMLEISK